MRRAAVAGVAAGLALLLGACGEEDDRAAQQTPTNAAGAVELTIVYDDGSGRRTSGALTCRAGDRRAEGALKGRAPAAELCAHARGISELLTSEPDRGRACTQIYGGPETALVTGTIEGEKVERRFSRTNGCELADFKRAAGLLQP